MSNLGIPRTQRWYLGRECNQQQWQWVWQHAGHGKCGQNCPTVVRGQWQVSDEILWSPGQCQQSRVPPVSGAGHHRQRGHDGARVERVPGPHHPPVQRHGERRQLR